MGDEVDQQAKEQITIFEVGPRDGLQNEAKMVATADKIALIDMLSHCGFSKIEATSFVSPKWVPQMADAVDVMAGVKRSSSSKLSALTPNLRGFTAAKDAKVDEVAIFASASEGFSQKNINCSIAESIERFLPILQAASSDNIPVRGYISCVVECPYDGATSPKMVSEIAALLMQLGCYEISLGDTLGRAKPEEIDTMLSAVLQEVDADKLAGHYHDTSGLALENIKASIAKGIRTFDSSIGGLGGCPYAPGAAGNVATHAVIKTVEAMGFETGINQEKLIRATEFARTLSSTL